MMTRASLARSALLVRPRLLASAAASSPRAFSVTARTMAAGDTGAPPKTGGQKDAFQKREQASEDYAIRQREKDKLKELRKKLTDQQEHIKKLVDHIDDISSDKGGEKN